MEKIFICKYQGIRKIIEIIRYYSFQVIQEWKIYFLKRKKR